MPAARVVTAVMFLSLLCAFASSARAAPVLELPRAWFEIVEPYRYVEARRFESGWNRGADVAVVGGDVRAPVEGRVRFAGSVAGRSIVTIDARVGGERAVVTITGLGARSVQVGDTVRIGEVLGRGQYVQVGAYAPQRRSRYFPVRASAAAPAAGAAAPDRAIGSPVADHVADRLRAAVLGTAVPRMPSLARMASTPIHVGGPGRAEVLARVRPGVTSRPDIGRPAITDLGGRAAITAAQAGRPTHVRGGRAWVAPWASRQSAVALPSVDRSGPSIGEPSNGGAPLGAGARPTSPSAAGPATGPPPPGAPGAGAPSRRAPAPSRPTAMLQDEVASSVTSNPDDDGERRSASAWTVPLALVVSLLPLVAFLRRRRPTTRPARPRLREPLPVVLPHVRPYAYPVVGREGASMLPDIALAWPDRDPGMGHDTESSARDSREPEHA